MCDDAITKVFEQSKSVKKKFEHVKVDLSLMIDIHSSLVELQIFLINMIWLKLLKT